MFNDKMLSDAKKKEEDKNNLSSTDSSITESLHSDEEWVSSVSDEELAKDYSPQTEQVALPLNLPKQTTPQEAIQDILSRRGSMGYGDDDENDWDDGWDDDDDDESNNNTHNTTPPPLPARDHKPIEEILASIATENVTPTTEADTTTMDNPTVETAETGSVTQSNSPVAPPPLPDRKLSDDEIEEELALFNESLEPHPTEAPEPLPRDPSDNSNALPATPVVENTTKLTQQDMGVPAPERPARTEGTISSKPIRPDRLAKTSQTINTNTEKTDAVKPEAPSVSTSRPLPTSTAKNSQQDKVEKSVQPASKTVSTTPAKAKPASKPSIASQIANRAKSFNSIINGAVTNLNTFEKGLLSAAKRFHELTTKVATQITEIQKDTEHRMTHGRDMYNFKTGQVFGLPDPATVADFKFKNGHPDKAGFLTRFNEVLPQALHRIAETHKEQGVTFSETKGLLLNGKPFTHDQLAGKEGPFKGKHFGQKLLPEAFSQVAKEKGYKMKFLGRPIVSAEQAKVMNNQTQLQNATTVAPTAPTSTKPETTPTSASNTKVTVSDRKGEKHAIDIKKPVYDPNSGETLASKKLTHDDIKYPESINRKPAAEREATKEQLLNEINNLMPKTYAAIAAEYKGLSYNKETGQLLYQGESDKEPRPLTPAELRGEVGPFKGQGFGNTFKRHFNQQSQITSDERVKRGEPYYRVICLNCPDHYPDPKPAQTAQSQAVSNPVKSATPATPEQKTAEAAQTKTSEATPPPLPPRPATSKKAETVHTANVKKTDIKSALAASDKFKGARAKAEAPVDNTVTIPEPKIDPAAKARPYQKGGGGVGAQPGYIMDKEALKKAIAGLKSVNEGPNPAAKMADAKVAANLAAPEPKPVRTQQQDNSSVEAKKVDTNTSSTPEPTPKTLEEKMVSHQAGNRPPVSHEAIQKYSEKIAHTMQKPELPLSEKSINETVNNNNWAAPSA